MAILKLHTYSKEKAFYQNELKLVEEKLEALSNDKVKLQNDALKDKKEYAIFYLKYNATALFLGLLSGFLERAMPGSMVITFSIQSILEEEINNLEGIKAFEDKLNKEVLKKLCLQDKLYILELINRGYLKFELIGKEMVTSYHSSVPPESLEFMELLDELTFIPDYYQNKKIKVKTLKEQIKIK